LDTANGEIIYNLARVYAQENRKEEALAAIKSALQKCISPSLVEVKFDPHFKNMAELVALLE